MSNNSFYKSITQAKNGSYIPVFSSNKTVESRYNPENSCEIILNSVSKSSFFVVTGIASGILIKKLLEKFPDCKIIGLEYSDADISFLKQLSLVSSLSQNKNVIFCSIKNLKNEIIKNYLPALHGDFKLVEQKPWILEHPELNREIPEIINQSLKQISADYSVQCHFGKRWQKNIITNLKLLDKHQIKEHFFDTSKTAAIIAAGPSLDSTLQILKQNRENYIIISTDTAYSSLLKNNIVPDAAVSIDGQLLSYNHFFKINKTTHFYIDLCGNSSAARNIIKKSENLHFFVSGHPFCNLVNNFYKNYFPFIYTGAGTVTISAIDIAVKAGFKKIQVFGADFAYLEGKSYTKGTYLDALYQKKSIRIKNIETNFDKLIFRIPLTNLNKNSYTTEVLQAYKASLENYLKDKNCSFEKKNNLYFIKSDYEVEKSFIQNKDFAFNYRKFSDYINSLSDEQLKIPLLPLIANLRMNNFETETEKLLKLARKIVVSYN